MKSKEAPSLDKILGQRATVKGVVDFVNNKLNITAENAPLIFNPSQEIANSTQPRFKEALHYTAFAYSMLTHDISPVVLWYHQNVVEWYPKRNTKEDIAKVLSEFFLPDLMYPTWHIN